jgi:hypothetical protein
VAELGASRKAMKYTEIAMDYMFQPIAVKNLGHINGSAVEFLEEFEN